jgi:hypothetical protein
MNTLTPYSDRWREHALTRMRRLGLDRATVGRITGLDDLAESALQDGDVSHEVTGPIDDLLDAREYGRECVVLVQGVDLGALADFDVDLTPRARSATKLERVAPASWVRHAAPDKARRP